MIYAICEDLFPDVEKKLCRIAKKCEKLGLPFVFERKGEEERKVYNERYGIIWYYNFILIEVEGTAKIHDWEFIATMEHMDAGNTIRRFNNEAEIPERFKTSENFCEHCASRRARKNLYLIHNVSTDEWKQVGGSCLKLYTGGLSMESIAHYMDGIVELENSNGKIPPNAKPMYNVLNIISRALEITNAVGYRPAGDQLPTRWMVSMLLNGNSDALDVINQHLMHEDPNGKTLCHRDLYRDESLNEARKIVEYYLSLTDNSEFTHNVQTIIKSESTSFKNFGFLCYLPTGYAKHLREMEERKTNNAENLEHFGEVGKRYKEEKVARFDLLTSWDNQFGYGRIYLYKITLASGEVLTWKTNKDIFEECWADDSNARICEITTKDGLTLEYYSDNVRRYTYVDTITFTVKAHSEYKSIKQTEVSRCKLTYRTETEYMND